MTVHFRPATADDLAQLHRLIESAYRGESAKQGWTHEADLLEGPRTTADELAASLRAPGEVLLIAHDGDALVGSVHVTRRTPDIAYLGLLTVDPRRQGDGLGKRILAAAEAFAAATWQATTMELSAIAQRSELIAYYERRGYARTGERRPFPVPMDPPFELVVLAKPLRLSSG